MSSQNDTTVQSYSQNAREYIDSATAEVSEDLKSWYQEVLRGVATSARIVEIGSATGRDALYIQSLGFRVECTDAAAELVDFLKNRSLNASLLDVVKDDIPRGSDVVIANAVLVHFTKEDSEKVLRKIFVALRPGGKFAFTFLQGVGERTADMRIGAPRYFKYWKEDEILDALQRTGFMDFSVSRDVLKKWLRIIAVKPKL